MLRVTPLMHVSANIIRFPAPAAAGVRAAGESVAQPAAEIVAFSPAGLDDDLGSQSQEHGQLYAAHRIVARVAEQLDALTPL